MSEEERYAKVETDKQNALNKSNQVYNDLINQNNQLANQQNEYIKNWQNTNNEIADKNAEYQNMIQNQNKEKAQKEFNNEAIASKNAYYDFINPYGANAEILAQNGLNNSGYSESSKVSAWNTQQNRTAQARTNMNNAMLQFDNSMKEIEKDRNATKAQYALEALQQQLEANIRQFDTTNTLKQTQLSNNQSIDNEYNNRWNNVWSQINSEKQLEEQRRQNEIQNQQWEREYALSQQKLYSNNNNYYNLDNETQQIQTPYYQGAINSDVQYGVFKTKDNNGVAYQPDNIGGSKLKSSGKTVGQVTGDKNFVNTSGVNVANQTAWKIGDQYYLWNGSKNKYEKLSAK